MNKKTSWKALGQWKLPLRKGIEAKSRKRFYTRVTDPPGEHKCETGMKRLLGKNTR